MDYFDPFADEAAAIARLREVQTRFLVVSFDTDWRFPTAHSTEIARVLALAGCDVMQEEVASPWGHDSFLLEVPRYHELVAAQLAIRSAAEVAQPLTLYTILQTSLYILLSTYNTHYLTYLT